MTFEDPAVQEALSEIQLIRTVIERTRVESKKKGGPSAPGAQLLALSSAGIVASLLAFEEWVDGGLNTQWLVLSSGHSLLRGVTVVMIGILLVFFLGAFYFFLWRSAKKHNEKLEEFILRNFTWLNGLSFFSDLLVKFTVLSVLVLAGQPQWFAPMLFLFIADYLFQGRFFVLPLRWATLAGLLSLAAAVSQYLSHSPSLLWPLIGFASVSFLSCLHLRRSQRLATSTGVAHEA